MKKFLIGVDLGGTNLKVALLDTRYTIMYKEILSTAGFHSKENLIAAISDSIEKILLIRGIPKQIVSGVGLGLPGLVDARRGRVHFFPNIPGWRDVPLKRLLEMRLRLPVYVDNDANLMCLAEYTIGAAQGACNAVCLTLGTGVGGGLIIEGRLYRGSSFAAGEIGHIPVNEHGPKCNCRGLACLESYIGNKRIMQEVYKVFGKHIPLEELSRLASAGNKKAKQVWITVAEHLGVCLSGVINLLNPDYVVMGGGIAGAGRVLFDAVRAVVRQRAMSVQARQVRIVPASLGNDAGLIGAAILVKEKGQL